MGIILVATNRDGGSRDSALTQFVCDSATVGRGADCDLCLPSVMLSQRHARFHFRDTGGDDDDGGGAVVVVVDLASTSGTWVNEYRIDRVSRPLSAHDVVRLGDWEVRVEPDRLVMHDTLDDHDAHAREKVLLDAIARDTPDADDIREVYGDWLMEQGRVIEAELLAIELRLRTATAVTAANTTSLEELEARRRELASRLDHRHDLWKCIVTRPPIESCTRELASSCPQTWDRLTPTKELRVRRCNTCRKRVYFMTNRDQAARRTLRGLRVAIDPGAKKSSVGT